MFLSGTNLDDLLDGFAHCLRLRLTLGDVALIVNLHSYRVLHFTGLAFLDNLGFARLQLRVDTHFDTERGVLGPLDGCGGGRALSTDLDDSLNRFRHTLGLGLRVRDLRVHDGLSRGHLVLTRLAFLDSFLPSGFQVPVEDDLGFEWHVLDVLTGVSAFGLGADLDDVVHRLNANFLCSVGLVDTLTRLTLLNCLDLAGFELRGLDNLDFESNLLGPFDALGWLGANADDLLYRLFDGLHDWLTVLDSHLNDAVLAFLIHDLLVGLKVLVVDDLGGVRQLYLLRLHRRCRVVGTHADDLLGRFLDALSGHGRIAIRLTVLDRLSRRHNLGTKLTFLVNDLLALFEFVIKDNFGLERNRLLNLGHHFGVLGCRAVLDDLVDRILGLLLFRGDSCLVARGSEVSSVGLLARDALLDDPDLTRLQLRVRAGLHLERNLGSPGDLLGRLGRLSADLDDLIDGLLGDLLLHGGFAIRLRVGDLLRHGDGLLTGLTLGDGLGLASRHLGIELDLHTERNLSLNGPRDLTSGLGTHADLLRCRFLGALSGHGRVARRLTVDEFLG